MAAAPAQAAIEISINQVVASGVQTQSFGPSSPAVCPPFGICPDIRSPFVTTVSGTLTPLVDSLSGLITLRGQDRALSEFFVTLDFTNSIFVSSSLSGMVQFGPSLNGSNSATFNASNFAITVRDTVTGQTRVLTPVPEPGTWAMMLLGFGVIGSAMRRRRSKRLVPHAA